MKYRIIYERRPARGYSVERFDGSCWRYLSGSISLTYWGARYCLWRHLRSIKPSAKPDFDVLYDVNAPWSFINDDDTSGSVLAAVIVMALALLAALAGWVYHLPR